MILTWSLKPFKSSAHTVPALYHCPAKLGQHFLRVPSVNVARGLLQTAGDVGGVKATGALTGAFVGDLVGKRVGGLTGANVGTWVGWFVGLLVGAFTGDFVGCLLGNRVGNLVGVCIIRITIDALVRNSIYGRRHQHTSGCILPS